MSSSETGETVRTRRYYSAAVGAVPNDGMVHAINALRTNYENGGCLSTLVWNIRNDYSAWPDGSFTAGQMQMVVEGFLAEVAALRAEHIDDQDGAP